MACGALLLSATPVLAHAPPFGISLFFADSAAATEPTVLTNRGLIFKAGSAFQLRCNAAYGAGTAENTLGFQEPDSARLVVRSFAGVFASEDSACTFTRSQALSTDPIGAFAVDSTLGRVLVSSLNYQATAGLMLSTDKARSFASLSSLPASSVVSALLIAPSDPQRVYAGGSRYDLVAAKLVNTWLVSDDGGATFRSSDIMFPRTPLGVHPTDKNIVFVADNVDDLAPEAHLLRSADGGNTFSTVLETTTLLSFASDADASHIWIGAGLGRDDTKRGGLFVSQDQGLTFAPALDQVNAATCLVQRGARLWVCANQKPNVGGIWYSDDQGATLSPYLTFDQVTEPVVCAGDATDADGGVCRMLWSDWVYEQTGGVGLDGGIVGDGGTPADGGLPLSDATTPDASDPAQPSGADATGGDAGPENTAKKHGGCSVYAPGSRAGGAWFGLWMNALAVFYRRRHAAGRRRSPAAPEA